MRTVCLTVWALTLAGCVQMRAPARTPPAFAPHADGWNHQVSMQFGPRMLQAGLPLLLAHQSPELPLYVRHLDRALVSIYTASGGDPTTSPAPRAVSDAWEVVLRLRGEGATITLLHDTATPALDRFCLLMDDDADRIVAYAEGNLWSVVRQALHHER